MIPENLKYKPISNDEIPLCGNIIYSILTNTEIMDTVRSRHSAGVRCAIISILENGVIVSGYVADQDAIGNLVLFAEVRDAVASYKMKDSICSVVIRDGIVAATISGNV